MPSNKELQAEAEALDANVDHTGLNNVQLVALVKELKAKAETPADAKAEAPTVYVVAEGMSLTSKAGVKVGGDVVKAEYFPEGRLAALIEAKAVVVVGK